jgi:WG containing repeat
LRNCEKKQYFVELISPSIALHNIFNILNICMKISFFVLCFLSFFTPLQAQKPRIETFADHRTETYVFKRGVGDSLRFVLRGQADTLQTVSFYRNGKPSMIVWANDSSHSFDVLGRLSFKHFSLLDGLDDSERTWDSSVVFHNNGRLREVLASRNGASSKKIYAKNGRLLLAIFNQYTPSVWRHQEEDGQGHRLSSSRVDTLLITPDTILTLSFDTTFYENGRLCSIQQTNSQNELLSGKQFNRDGSLAFSELPDSLKLLVFKDNIDCYYGLKNKRGDTVIAPKFDRIREIGGGDMAAYTGNSCIILHADGSIMPLPVPNLSNIELLSAHSDDEDDDENDTYFDMHYGHLGSKLKEKHEVYFSISAGGKHGVMDTKGKLVVPFQPLPIERWAICHDSFFNFIVRKGDTILRTGYLNRQGKTLFSEQSKWVGYTGFKDYFTVSKGVDDDVQTQHRVIRLDANEGKKRSLYGLGTGYDERIVLEPKFTEIDYLPRVSLFLVSFQSNKKSGEHYRSSLFNPRSKQWLLDTTHFYIDMSNYEIKKAVFFICKNIKTKKYGIIDSTGTQAVPIVYDSIGLVDAKKGLFWLRKDEKLQLFSVSNGKPFIHTPQYDWLTLVNFQIMGFRDDERVPIFIAKSKGKWGVIDENDQIIKPFDYDYASTNYSLSFLLVKNNQAAYFDFASLPNESPEGLDDDAPLKINTLHIIGRDPNRVFFINDTGKVVIPPQYKLLHESSLYGNCALVEDEQKRKKLIFFATGAVVDYALPYSILFASPESRLMIVKDTAKEMGYGVVSIESKILMPPVNYGVAIGDEEGSVFFVKRDTPLINRYQNWEKTVYVAGDTLNAEDNNWLMYGADGKLLNSKPFRFPIKFRDSVGVGMQDGGFFLYRTDGSVVLPFTQNGVIALTEYNNIRRDPEHGYYVLFRNQGLTPTMLVTDTDGKILVESGRYDGISRFFGKYALVSAAGRVGLIDSTGREIVAPQDLQAFKE